MCQYPGMLCYILRIQKCIFDACRQRLHNSGLICNQLATVLITKTQADQIEAIQKRAIRIIYTCTYNMTYVSATFVADLFTMSDRRDQLSRKFFNSTLQPTSPLHSFLPPPRDQLPTTRLRAASKFPRIPTRTKKYQSFLSYALAYNNIQSQSL